MSELGNLEQPTRLRPPRQPPYQRDTCLSGWFVCGFLSAKVFNLAKPPSLTNCHVRKEEHRTRVTVNMKGGERQEWRVAGWFRALRSLPLAAVVSVSESSSAILQRLSINLLTCGRVTPLTSAICLLSVFQCLRSYRWKSELPKDTCSHFSSWHADFQVNWISPEAAEAVFKLISEPKRRELSTSPRWPFSSRFSYWIKRSTGMQNLCSASGSHLLPVPRLLLLAHGDLGWLDNAGFEREERPGLPLMAHLISPCSSQHFESCGEKWVVAHVAQPAWVETTAPSFITRLSAGSVELCEGRWMNHAGITPLSLCFVSIKGAYIHSACIRYIQRNKKPVADTIRSVKRNLTCTSGFNPPLLPTWLILLLRWMGVGLYSRSLRKMSSQASLLFCLWTRRHMWCQYLQIKSREQERPSFLTCKVIVELWIRA